MSLFKITISAGTPATSQRKVWPTNINVPNPGPTFMTRLGDTVQITLLNQVNVKNFPGTLDMFPTRPP